MFGLRIGVWTVRPAGGSDTTPGGAAAALLMENGNGIALESGSGVILME